MADANDVFSNIGAASSDLGNVGTLSQGLGSQAAQFKGMLTPAVNPPPVREKEEVHAHLRFSVMVGSVYEASFSECSALTVENEVFEYHEGGVNSYVHKLPTRTKYGNVTLKRGVDESQYFFRWFVDIASGKVKRENVSIVLYSRTKQEVRRWDLRNAYVCKWTGPDLGAHAGAIAVETIELAHEGLIPMPTKTYAPDADAAGLDGWRKKAADALAKVGEVTGKATEVMAEAATYANSAKGVYDEVEVYKNDPGSLNPMGDVAPTRSKSDANSTGSSDFGPAPQDAPAPKP